MTQRWKLQPHGKVQPPSDSFGRLDGADSPIDGPARDAQPAHTRLAGGHYPSVLIVDDDPVFRTTLEAFFTLHGTRTVRHASEGAQAYAALCDGQTPDLVVLDLNMPELDGIEFLALMQEHQLGMPLLVISSAGRTAIRSAETLAKVYGLNFLGAMSKPVNFDHLRTVLKLSKRTS